MDKRNQRGSVGGQQVLVILQMEAVGSLRKIVGVNIPIRTSRNWNELKYNIQQKISFVFVVPNRSDAFINVH